MYDTTLPTAKRVTIRARKSTTQARKVYAASPLPLEPGASQQAGIYSRIVSSRCASSLRLFRHVVLSWPARWCLGVGVGDGGMGYPTYSWKTNASVKCGTPFRTLGAAVAVSRDDSLLPGGRSAALYACCIFLARR